MPSIITEAGIVFKKITGVKDISLLRKNLHKKAGQIIYHRKYTSDDVIAMMKDMGMKAGSVICVHASMKEFYNYEGTAEELITKIENVITEEGTLMMPAYPTAEHQQDENFIFDPQKEKTAAGYLAETFRKSPGVKRSINIQHSVCAWGKLADWLVKDHQYCENCWDKDSPWYRMVQAGGLVFTLGLSSNYIGTFDHCVEALLCKDYPYWKLFFNKRRTYHYLDENNEVKSYSCLTSDLERRSHEKTLMKYFSPDIFKKARISNLLIKMFDAKPCLDKMIALGRKGITMYYVPSPRNYKFGD